MELSRAISAARCLVASALLLAAPASAGVQGTELWSSGERTRALDWADWDRDGDLDLLAGGADGLSVYTNQGGTLTLAWSSDAIDSIRDVAWGRFWGDDDLPDVAVAGDAGSAVLFANHGGTALEGVGVLPTPEGTDPTRAVAWADADADGDLDLAVAYEGGFARLYLNDQGTFETPAQWRSPDIYAIEDLVWADVNGDGQPDLTIVAATWADTVLFLNQGGTFGQEPTVLIEALSTTDVAWGDIDGDGDLDLAAAHRSNGQDPADGVQVWRFEGGLPVDLCWTSPELDESEGIAWGDIDGDGDLDLAVANTDGTPDRVYEQHEGSGPCGIGFYPETLTDDEGEIYATDSYDVAFVDLDGDGALEVSFARTHSPTIEDVGAWVYEVEFGSLQAYVELNDGEDRDVDWGDFDGDGDLDLAVAAKDGPRVLTNLGDGTFHPAPAWADTRDDPTNTVAWGDVDLDGDLDLAVGYSQYNDASIRLFLNEGGALAEVDVWAYAEDQRTSDLAWGDFDGDGDLDLAAAAADGPTRVFRNDQAVLTVVFVTDPVDGESAVAWGDVDGDGDLDLATSSPGGFAVVHTTEDGVIQDGPWTSAAGVGEITGLAWGDWNGDGAPDLAVAGPAGPTVHTNLAGTLLPEAIDLTAWSNAVAWDVAWGDWDGDGLDDLGVASRDPEEASPGSTTAPTVFGAVEGALEPRWWGLYTDDSAWGGRALAWADYDLDGDLDLALASPTGPTRLHRNERRDPHRTGGSAPGARWIIDHQGWPLTASGHGEAVPRPIYGDFVIEVLLELDPGDTVDLQAQLHDPQEGWISDPLWRFDDLAPKTPGVPLQLFLPGFRDHITNLDRRAVRLIVDPDPSVHLPHPTTSGAFAITTPPWRMSLDECFPADADGDGVHCLDDCDDSDPTAFPAAPELCDGLDNDCDGVVDDDHDADGDGSPCSEDCDDADPHRAPGVEELCSDADDRNCDGTVGSEAAECWTAGCSCSAPGPAAPRGVIGMILLGWGSRRRRS